ncbi:MAG: hypothetical protein JWQ42_4283 [Edaphobacter sp.]|nr:hypothetical protein [Edaphobacter sp.]
MTTLFQNTVTLRGFLADNAKVPPSDGITEDAFGVLFVALMSGTWDIATNQWTPRITTHQVVCPGPWFCGFTRGMQRGDYVEVEGELYIHDHEHPVVVEGERFSAKRYVCEIRAIQVRKLDRPLLVVDTGSDG